MVIQKSYLKPDPGLDFREVLQRDKERLTKVDVPIVTTSASFKSDLTKSFGEQSTSKGRDIVFSRGHFSMAIALYEQAAEKNLSTWLIDPTNYVSKKDWGKFKEIVAVGQLVARFPLLKHIKDFLDTKVRGKLPIAQAITSPLLYATADITKPILSVHYETGNILGKDGHVVLQVVTDPHIRPQYLEEASRKNIYFAVFNQQTQKEFKQKAQEAKVDIDKDRIVVTGPPVDPRITRARLGKSPDSYKKRPLRLVIATGGLGQNKDEISTLLNAIGPLIQKNQIQVILYASTLPDFREMYEDIADKYNIPISAGVQDENSPLRIIFSSSIVDANQALIEHAFSWADGFVTKPSGDMAYDAAAAGCFILSLTPWGDWEVNIEKIFSNLSILKKADAKNLDSQIQELSQNGWFSQAINNALRIEKTFLTGAQNIITLQQKLTKIGIDR